MRTFEQIPTLPEFKAKPRPEPINFYEPMVAVHNALGPILNFADRVWISDSAAIAEVLSSDRWVKGKSTVEPFQSIVPLHLISLEGELHQRLRSTATKALNYSQLKESLYPIIVDETRAFMAKLERSNLLHQLDKHCRAFSLDVISTALFTRGWGAQGAPKEGQNENTPTQFERNAQNLSQAMECLHWRISDLTDDGWRKDRMEGSYGPALSELEDWVANEVRSRRSSLADQASASDHASDQASGKASDQASDQAHASSGGASVGGGTPVGGRGHMSVGNMSVGGEDLLGKMMNNDRALDDWELTQLCLTFLTMGHENVASAIGKRNTLYTIHCTPHTVHYTLYIIHCTRYTVHHTLSPTLPPSLWGLKFVIGYSVDPGAACGGHCPTNSGAGGGAGTVWIE
jgi:cytochrome P450